MTNYNPLLTSLTNGGYITANSYPSSITTIGTGGAGGYYTGGGATYLGGMGGGGGLAGGQGGTFNSLQPIKISVTVSGETKTFNEIELREILEQYMLVQSLVEEQPAVKKASENLELIVKLYKTNDEIEK